MTAALLLQVLANGLVLGGLYACIAAGFSLVWGVLNVINILHGSFIVLGSYVAYFAHVYGGVHPFLSVVLGGAVLFALAYVVQARLINPVVAAPVLTTLILTFGLDLLLNNAMLLAFKADYRKVNLENPLGLLRLGGVVMPLDRIAAMALAINSGGALSSYQTIPLLTVEEAMAAMRKAAEISYRPPGAAE